MTKSDLEKALEFLPSLKDIRENDNLYPDIHNQYKPLRAAERAYEQLQKAGLDVGEQLKERRYQVAELIADILELEITHNLKLGLRDRDIDEESMQAVANLRDYADKLTEVFKRINPNLEVKTDDLNSVQRLFPED